MIINETLWKGKDESPEYGRTIFVEYENGTYNTFHFHITYPLRDWVRWCYLDDLLALEQENKELRKQQLEEFDNEN